MGRVSVFPLFDPMPWRAKGACNGVDPDLFFPARGESVAAAKALCAGCPVRDECLQFALDNNERFGIWGGLSERERRRVRRQRNKAATAAALAAVPEGHKRCSGCRTVKPVNQFHRDSTSVDGLNSRCGECRTVYNARRPKAA